MVEDIASLSDEEVMAEAREDYLLSEWNLMVYGYTYPHWNKQAERQAKMRAWLDGIIKERFRNADEERIW
jgi:hypothetical protein